MAYIELLSRWIHSWLSKLYLKRNKKTNINKYQICINLLIKKYLSQWNNIINNEWRSNFKKRMYKLEKLLYSIYETKLFWDKKCE